jgi:hypothetical protein
VKRSILSLAALLLAFAGPARAQVQGALSPARVLQPNEHLGGAYLTFDKSSATLLGQLRMSFYPNFDFGFQGGLSRIDVDENTRTSVKLGGDFRAQVAFQKQGSPVDLALGGALGVESADELNQLSVGPQVHISRVLDLREQWVAYGGAALLFTRIELAGESNTDTSFPLRLGMEYHPNPYLRLLVETQLAVSDEVRDDFALTFGVVFPF